MLIFNSKCASLKIYLHINYSPINFYNYVFFMIYHSFNIKKNSPSNDAKQDEGKDG
jgi:hypothetical protein